MTAQKGRDLLLKLDNDGSGNYQAVAGLRSHTLSFNSQSVDITHQESTGAWRELLAGAGVRSASINGSGIFKDAQSDATIRQIFFNNNIVSWQVIIPDFGIVSGPFQITSLEFSGEHDGEMTFDLALESAGSLNFTSI